MMHTKRLEACFCDLKDTVDNLTLNVTKEPRRLVFAEGRRTNTSNAYVFGCGITRTGVGQYTVTFNNPHPGGTNYIPVFGQGEDSTNRDVPKVSWVEGTLTANGFDVQTTVDDNGVGADVYRDAERGFSVNYTEFDYVVDVALV